MIGIAQEADARRIVEMVCDYMEDYGDLNEMMDCCPAGMELGECIFRDAAMSMADPCGLLDWFIQEGDEASFRGWIDREQPYRLRQVIDALRGYIARWGC